MITVVKIGGHVLDDEALLGRFCKDFIALAGTKLLVHGGGALAGEVQKALGIEPRMVEGRRVTDADTLRVVTMVYSGWCNKRLVALLQSLGCNAIGLSGCDAGCITSAVRPPRVLADGKTKVDYGFVGDVRPSSIDTRFVHNILGMGLVPVFSAINHDGRGQLLNTNADTVASSIAAALGARLVCCFEKEGVLSDVDDPSSVIPFIDSAEFERLKASGTVAGGMLPKLENAFAALRQGVPEVILKSASGLLSRGGTKICL
jgi:acetylglutamate kinase